MADPLATPPPMPPEQRRRRQRRIFLTLSALTAIAIILVANEVLLPFVLGLVVAYVLLPAVLRIQRLGVPRWAAILIVYALLLGSIAGFIALIVPSLVREARQLSRELPGQIAAAQEKYGPIVDAKLRAWSARDNKDKDKEKEHDRGRDPSRERDKPKLGGRDAPDAQSADPPTSELPPDQAAPPERPREPDDSALVLRPRGDGSYSVEVNDRAVLRKVGEDAWRVEIVEREEPGNRQLLKKLSERATKYFSENTVELLKLGQQIIAAISRGIFNLFMTLMLGGYMMLTHERILRFFKDLVGRDAEPAFERLLHRLDRGLSGVVRGQLIICLVNGVLSAIGFWLFDLKYWPLMALVAAVGSLIPIFGSILSAFPAVAIGLTQSPGTAFAVLAWIIGIHQLEANFLNPKIIGDAAKIHPVLVVFALLVGEHFFQIKGALFAVPCLSVMQTFFLHFRETTMGIADPTSTHVPPSQAARPESTAKAAEPSATPSKPPASQPPADKPAPADDPPKKT